jgi:hypothetical protein
MSNFKDFIENRDQNEAVAFDIGDGGKPGESRAAGVPGKRPDALRNPADDIGKYITGLTNRLLLLAPEELVQHADSLRRLQKVLADPPTADDKVLGAAEDDWMIPTRG